ncbi:MAG TPA: serine/threonine-protein kinase, partial [Pyrinomonadaceae bacterium]
MIENGTLLQDRYLIEQQIGAGGMGAVYRAIDQRFGSYVAIKETFYKDDELGVAFEREARLLNSLHHPVLPHVSDYFAENNGYFLVMQFIDGEDFSDILKREGAFAPADLVRWANSLLDALDYLHSQEPPIIHRDIKPHNLKLTPRGDIILLDFGLAKLSSGETTGAVSVFGYSRTYSPLEQIQGTGTDARSDIFSLGATA